MGDVNLGSSGNQQPDSSQVKQKMIYMNIPTGLLFISESYEIEPMTKYANAIIQSIKGSLTNVELRKTILQTFGVKTVKKMERLRSNEFKIFTEIFGGEIWGKQ